MAGHDRFTVRNPYALSSLGIVPVSVDKGLVADVGQSQGDGALTKAINEVATVANSGDCVTLISAVEGYTQKVFNNGANPLTIFPASGDNCGAGVDASIVIGPSANIVFSCWDATVWETN
jgi:hypothetical protein